MLSVQTKFHQLHQCIIDVSVKYVAFLVALLIVYDVFYEEMKSLFLIECHSGCKNQIM